MTKRQLIYSSLYRILIASIIIYSIWTSVDQLNQEVLIKMAAFALFAIVFSALWKNRITAYIEWAAVLGLIYYFNGQALVYMLLIVPIILLITLNLKYYEVIGLSISVGLFGFLAGNSLTMVISLAAALFLGLSLMNENFRRISKLEQLLQKTEKQVSGLKLDNSKKENQINVTSRLFFHKKILEDVNDFKTLINKLIGSTHQLFNSDYVGFYLYRNGAYVKIGEKGEAKDFVAPPQISKKEGSEIGYQDKILRMPIKYQRQPWGYLLIYGKKSILSNSRLTLETPFESRDYEILSMLIETAIFRLREIKRNEKLEAVAFYDRLTNVPNRAHLEKNLIPTKLEELKESETPMYVMMLDIDNFKSFNDTFGHAIGDEVLINVARIAKEALEGLNKGDVVGRWGGEEFFGLLNGKEEVAKETADLVRKRIEEYNFEHRQITVSIGIAKIDALNPDVEEHTHQADIALYVSKENGKNQVTVYQKGMTK